MAVISKIRNLIDFWCFGVVTLRCDMSQENNISIYFLEIPKTAWQNRACNPFVCVDCRPKVSKVGGKAWQTPTPSTTCKV